VSESADLETDDTQEWLELAVEVDAEAVEAVSEVFARHGYNEGVAVDQPFTQEADGDKLAVDITRPFTVRTFVAASDLPPEALEEIRQALWFLGRLRQVGELRVTAGRLGTSTHRRATTSSWSSIRAWPSGRGFTRRRG
jgi:ribosomal protein L11 methyltransferase